MTSIERKLTMKLNTRPSLAGALLVLLAAFFLWSHYSTQALIRETAADIKGHIPPPPPSARAFKMVERDGREIMVPVGSLD